jgi:hypothetical protein
MAAQSLPPYRSRSTRLIHGSQWYHPLPTFSWGTPSIHSSAPGTSCVHTRTVDNDTSAVNRRPATSSRQAGFRALVRQTASSAGCGKSAAERRHRAPKGRLCMTTRSCPWSRAHRPSGVRLTAPTQSVRSISASVPLAPVAFPPVDCPPLRVAPFGPVVAEGPAWGGLCDPDE